jgi:uncharacterized SAM-binding protein YcdF (DUF218 family)
MFFILSKVLFYIVMPLTWILVLLLISIFSKRDKWRKRSLLAATVLLIFFTNPFISNSAYLWWEYPPTEFRNLKQYDVAIILTGFTGQDKSPHDRIYTNKGADRVLLPLRLYREGYIKSFIIAGGSGSILKKYSSEAEEIKKILLYAGVPAEHILLEDKSRNTHENAMFTKKLLTQHPQFQKLLLVTSAFHMRRAKGCFKKEQIATDVFSTDFYSSDMSFTPDKLLIPQEASLYLWQRLIHEMVGYATYKLTGYL